MARKIFTDGAGPSDPRQSADKFGIGKLSKPVRDLLALRKLTNPHQLRKKDFKTFVNGQGLRPIQYLELIEWASYFAVDFGPGIDWIFLLKAAEKANLPKQCLWRLWDCALKYASPKEISPGYILAGRSWSKDQRSAFTTWLGEQSANFGTSLLDDLPPPEMTALRSLHIISPAQLAAMYTIEELLAQDCIGGNRRLNIIVEWASKHGCSLRRSPEAASAASLSEVGKKLLRLLIDGGKPRRRAAQEYSEVQLLSQCTAHDLAIIRSFGPKASWKPDRMKKFAESLGVSFDD